MLGMLGRIFIFLFGILLSSHVVAQEIHFRIVEKDKEEAIPGALIVYNNDEHQMTNWKGESYAVLKSTSTIRVKMLGYQEVFWQKEEWTTKLKIHDDGIYHLQIELLPIANESSTLVVSSSLYGRSIRENSQSIERIDGRDVMRKRTTDLSSALERVSVSQMVSASSPLSGCETSRSSRFTPSFLAYAGSSACSTSMNAARPPAFCALATMCNINVVLPEDSGP